MFYLVGGFFLWPEKNSMGSVLFFLFSWGFLWDGVLFSLVLNLIL